MSISMYQLFSEINDYTHATLDGYQVDRIVFDAVGKTITVHCPTFYVSFHDQMAQPSKAHSRGLCVLSTEDGQPWTMDLFNGRIAHGAFERPEWDKLPLDTIVFEGVEEVRPAPFVYRLEDSSGHRHLVRYLRLPGDGNHQRTFIDSASLDDENGLRRLLQQTRDYAARDGGEGYYDTEMIWLQKGHQIGSVDGPPIPPIPTNLDTSKLPEYEPSTSFSQVLDALNDAGDARDIDAEYRAGLKYFQDHLQACERDLTMAKHLVETFEAGDKVVQQLAGFSKDAATAAKAEIVKAMHENVKVNLWLEKKPR